MRIHSLVVEAFGPFADRIEVDVDELGSAGVFLIHGPTGAGKTSLLDAIAFALFADVPGARSKKGLRSDHAPRDRVPSVVLDVTIGGRRLRLTRSPEFVRPKVRGTGTVSVPAKVALEELRGAQWEALSARHDEVAELVHDLLGMGLAQFAKVVVLPQGDFAAFLRASPEDRRALLERLFDISTFADVEEWLAGRRRRSTAEAEATALELDTILARIDDHSALAGSCSSDGRGGGPDPSALDDEAPADLTALREDTDALAARLLASLDEADAAASTGLALVDAAALQERACATRLHEARQRLVLRTRAERARAELTALEAEVVEHTERCRRRDRGRRALGLAGHLDALGRAEGTSLRLADEFEALHASLLAAGVQADDPAREPIGELAIRARAHDAGSHAIDAARRRATQLRSRHAESSAAAEAVSDRVVHLAEREKHLAARVASRETALAAARASLPDLEKVTADLVEIQDLCRVLAQVAEDDRLLAQTLEEQRTALDTSLTARAEHLDLKERHLDGLAAELAAELSPGSRCPVCGSCEHPQPASAAAAVRRADLEAAEARVTEAGERVQDLAVRVATITARRTERMERLGGADAASLAARERGVRTLLDLGQQTAREIEALEASLTGDSEHHRQVLADLDHAREETAAVGAVRADIEREVGRLEADLAELLMAHTGCPCWTQEHAAEWTPQRHEDVVALLTRADQVEQRALRAAEEVSACQVTVADAVQAAGFDDVDDARSALLPDTELTELARAIGHHEDARTAALALLSDPDVLAALEAPEDDLDDLTRADEQARAAWMAATKAHVGAEARHAALAKLIPLAITCARTHRNRADRAAAVTALADTVAGLGPHNPKRMRLTAYVLAARLERVVSFANERLTQLGAGRYLLEHTDERTGAGRSGLGLRVLDQWTGQTRDTTTLSGGETFMASLALALGLADAVRSEVGGHDLGTLFVDEGFGSLDDDSLEEVMTVLDGLQDGGRTVGVVSHVADLRTRIPRQLIVHKTPDGSSVSTTCTLSAG